MRFLVSAGTQPRPLELIDVADPLRLRQACYIDAAYWPQGASQTRL